MVSTSLSSRSSSAVNSRRRARSRGCEPPVLAGGQLVQEAAAQVFLQRLPRLGRLTEPGQHGGQCGGALNRLVPARSRPVNADREPGRIQALHPTAAIGLAPRGTSPGR